MKMKTKLLFLFFVVHFVFLFCSSCSSLQNNKFAKRKYLPHFTTLRRDTPAVTSKMIIENVKFKTSFKRNLDFYSNGDLIVDVENIPFIQKPTFVAHGNSDKIKRMAISEYSVLKSNIAFSEKKNLLDDTRITQSWVNVGLAFCVFSYVFFIFSLITASFYLLLFAGILSLLSVFFSFIGLINIFKNPEKYKGKGKAFVVLLLALLPLILAVVVYQLLFL